MPYFTDKYYGIIQTFKDKVEQAVYRKIGTLKITAWVTPEPVAFNERTSGKKLELDIDKSWGKLWDCAWFNFKGTIPQEAEGKNVVLLIDISGEACIFDKDGCPVQGLTNVNSGFEPSLGKPGKRVVRINESMGQGKSIDIWADAGCNDLFGMYKDSGSIKEAHIAACNEAMRSLYYDIEVLQELMQQLPQESARRNAIMFSLREAAKIMNKYDEEEAIKARGILAKELNKRCGDESLSISAIGHAHIDLAWLWPIRETIRKGARTFSTALKNIELYPDYVFGASQPQLYQWMKEHYPGLFNKIRQRIEEGRWEPQGAMWVEADTNISGGEALVRQVLYGKKFFREEFGKDIKTLWLPDVFGYSAALPQILKKAGVDYFMTIKLSWNDFNRFPHHTFLWQGIDGSKVLAHMPPEGTYNSSAAPRAVIKAEREFLDKGVSDECLMLFGIGDGGGGPSEEHLERLQREKNLNGLIPVKQEQSIEFFKRIEKDMQKYKTWCGELYLEKHQGTYTTQARNKRFNRKLELALRDLELASVEAFVNNEKPYPQEEIESIWKEVLLYQFHDILPGSSIKRVYDESCQRYEHLLDQVVELTESADNCLYGKSDVQGRTQSAVVINSLSWDRSEWVRIGYSWNRVTVPAMGHSVIRMYDEKISTYNNDLAATDGMLENEIFRVSFNEDGTMGSIYDKEAQREALEHGASGNAIMVYDDNDGDAWDFSPLYSDRHTEPFALKSTEYWVDGPRCILVQNYEFNNSKLVQEIILTSDSRRIDFKTRIDWQETGKMLRTSFKTNVFTDGVNCDIQFGTIKRPNNENTSWDMAKYEICAHKWIDMSQRDYGVALLNDCKYGHKVRNNVIDLNLLRSTSNPGTDADKGEHEFTYSLYPHEGNHIDGGVIHAAYELNVPLRVHDVTHIGNMNEERKSFITVDSENVIIEAVKKAEYSDDIIVRLYECCGSSVKARLNFGFEVKEVQLVNLMEEVIDEACFDKSKNELTFRPYEIHTLKIKH